MNRRSLCALSAALLISACKSDLSSSVQLDVDRWAKGCYSLRDGDNWLAADGKSYAFNAKNSKDAARFFMQPSDLGTYLFYDENSGYLVAEEGPLTRETSLQSDVLLVDDDYVSGAEWILETSENAWNQYQLRNRRNNLLLSPGGLTTNANSASSVVFVPAEGCIEHPELSLDATGEVAKTTFEDGDLYGIVDTHSHIMSNFGFGGGGIYHGGPYHRLGIEHALPDCEPFHGVMGRSDFFGFAYDAGSGDLGSLLPSLISGELPEDNHFTAGYPDFTDWPDARKRTTHQTQYYRWLERAHLAGLRLVVQHATTNSVICNLSAGEGFQPTRYDCEDMTAVDRSIEETYSMERYIDAQSGGPGQGWFRVVQTPAEAREVIEKGKMAVILGIETSDLFNCHLTPRPDGPVCDEAYVVEQLDTYYERGIRVLFPVHKYDNAFSPGDGNRDFIEAGNFFNTGHWTNRTEDCPDEPDMPLGFDKGGISFGGLQMPRDEYQSEAPNDFSNFPNEPILTALPFLFTLQEPSIAGDWCQNATMTPLGETLMLQMMQRGMIIEVDHFPQWAYVRAYELLEENDYPAAATHGRNWNGRLFALGGVSKGGFGRCQDSANPGSTIQGYLDRIDQIAENGGYPAQGYGFDLNGFAGAPRPRFGEEGCSEPQENPITYPFTSYDGGVEFSQPFVGNRQIDFNTEGLVHIGMLPELLQDARADAISDKDIEPMFRSAEGYIRMWERAEERAAALRTD